MKKFARIRTLPEIRDLCQQRGFELNAEKYEQGSDWVTIRGTFANVPRTVIYRPFGGSFIGRDDHGNRYSELSSDLDGTDWYDAILALVYVPETEGEAHAG